VRKFVVRASHLEDLVTLGTLTTQVAAFLDAAVASGLNILVAGGTQAGKPVRRQYTQRHSHRPRAISGTTERPGQFRM
jgi:hypothetical protein